jgi:hypothetical protein
MPVLSDFTASRQGSKQNRRASVNVKAAGVLHGFPSNHDRFPIPVLPKQRRHDKGWSLLRPTSCCRPSSLPPSAWARSSCWARTPRGAGAVADHLRFNPESRLVNFHPRQGFPPQRSAAARIGAGALPMRDSILEGTGLYLEKAWGEYLTLAITASFLPLGDLRDLCAGVTMVRVSLAGGQRPGLPLSFEAGDGEAAGQKESPARRKKTNSLFVRYIINPAIPGARLFFGTNESKLALFVVV